MPKIIERWLLFKYIQGQFTPLSKPFKTKAAAEKARLKLPERERHTLRSKISKAGCFYGALGMRNFTGVGLSRRRSKSHIAPQ
jgi:hypothetical protein